MSRFLTVYRVLSDFISLLFPRLCQCCGEHLVRNEEVICTGCILDIPLTNFHRDIDNEMEISFWGRCLVEKAAAWSFYIRGGKTQTLTHRLKYLGITVIGTYLGKHYGRVLLASGFLEGIDIIIPVPLHRSKERKRGFNQSRVIAEGISSVTGILSTPEVLQRSAKTSTQTRKTRVERWENVEGVFRADRLLLKSVNHILLVDDVVTTGATIEACVNAIKRVADVKVSVVSLAFARSGST